MATGFGTGEFGQFPPDTASLTKTKDPWYSRGLCHRVAVEFDTNNTSSELGELGANLPKYVPVPGYEDVPCRFGKQTAMPTEGEGRPGQMTSCGVQFAVALPLDRRNRLVQEDRLHGTRYWYVVGRAKEQVHANGTFHHLSAQVQDKPL